MKLRAMAVEMPIVHGHPNRVPFEGVLTFVDVASDRAPSGAKGHRVVLTRQAAVEALPSLLGMGVDFSTRWDGHNAQRKCGIITDAEVEGLQLVVAGYLFGKDFPEVAKQMASLHASGTSGAMGMSYELADAHVEDMRAQIWKLRQVTFTGAAILLRTKAAYSGTSFALKEAVKQSGYPMKLAATRLGLNKRKKAGMNLSKDMKIMATEETMGLVAERLSVASTKLESLLADMEERHAHVYGDVQRIVATAEGAFGEQREASRQDLERKLMIAEQTIASLQAQMEANATASVRRTAAANPVQMFSKTGVDTVGHLDAGALDAVLTGLSLEQRIAVKAKMARAGLLS